MCPRQSKLKGKELTTLFLPDAANQGNAVEAVGDSESMQFSAASWAGVQRRTWLVRRHELPLRPGGPEMPWNDTNSHINDQ